VIALLRRSLAQGKFIIAGAAALLAGFQFILIAQAVSIEETSSFGRVAELLPAFLRRELGDQALIMATFRGTVAFGYFHPVVSLVLCLTAMYLTTEPTHEVEAGLVDLVLARSVPRRRLLTRSLLLAVATMVVILSLMMAGTFGGLQVFGATSMPGPTGREILLLAVHLFATGWCFAGIGLAVAAGARRWSTAYTLCSAIAVVSYLVDFLAIGWPPARIVAWLSPFYYDHALPILAGAPASRMARDLGVLVTAGAVFAALAYWRFSKRDI
jgi:ABC-type transport system involved in multi-copper enzyme maturation permease subunit